MIFSTTMMHFLIYFELKKEGEELGRLFEVAWNELHGDESSPTVHGSTVRIRIQHLLTEKIVNAR
jgi:hypothetical protein